MSTHGKGATERWLQELTALAGGVENESDRGQFLQRVHSAVANLKHDNIADLIGLILDTGAWRSYTYPNGEHYEFRAREFDYFLAQQDIDPRMVRNAASYADDGELRALLVESSLDKHGNDRRSVEEITEAYPKLRPWLEKYGLRTLGPKSVYESITRLEGFKAGKSSRAPGRKIRWEADAPTRDELPAAIAEKLLKDPALLASVLPLLEVPSRPIVTPIVTGKIVCGSCGEQFDPGSGKARYCSQVCRNRAQRQRKRQA